MRRHLAVPLLATLLTACEQSGDAPLLSKAARVGHSLELGQYYPARSEAATSGPISTPVRPGSRERQALVRFAGDEVVFKDEEGDGSDRIMSARLAERLSALAGRVGREWPAVDLRVTEAWDPQGEHGSRSLHYEGRAVDLTTSDLDPTKLGRLAALAVEAGFDWVIFENRQHVHASVRR